MAGAFSSAFSNAFDVGAKAPWYYLLSDQDQQVFKNVASQKITLFVFDTSTGLPKTGDAANITAYVSKDDGAVTVLGDTSATELDSTNAKGLYSFDLTQAETNADKLVFSGKSSTSNVSVVPKVIYAAVVAWDNVRLPASTVNLSATTVKTVTDVETDTQDIQSRLPAALVSGRMNSNVQAMADGVVTADAIATDALGAAELAAAAVSEIQTSVSSLLPGNFSSMSIDANGRVRIQSGVTKNAAITDFEFKMVDSTDHVTGKTGLTITATRSLDGAAFSACANSATEVGGGIYKINLAAGDMNAEVVTLRFSGSGADTRECTIRTTP